MRAAAIRLPLVRASPSWRDVSMSPAFVRRRVHQL